MGLSNTPTNLQDRLRALWRLATDRTLDEIQKIDAMLEAATAAMNMETALVGEVDDHYTLSYLFDATGMADEGAMAKIGIGRDAADVAFLTAYGPAQMNAQSVSVIAL